MDPRINQDPLVVHAFMNPKAQIMNITTVTTGLGQHLITHAKIVNVSI